MIIIYKDVSCTKKEDRWQGRGSELVRQLGLTEMPTCCMCPLDKRKKEKSKAKLFLCEQIIYMSSFFQQLQRISSTLAGEVFSFKREKKKSLSQN